MEKLNAKHRLAIVALAGGGTIDQAAKAAKVTGTTVDNWLKFAVFRDELNAAIDRAFELSLQQAALDYQESLERLRTIRDSSESANRDVIRACELLMNNAWRRRELRLESRLTELEGLIDAEP